MKKKLLPFLAVVMLSLIAPAHAAKTAKVPKIAIKENSDVILYNGKSLKLCTPLQEWIKVIGIQPRKVFDKSVYTWDDLGFYAITTIKDRKILVENLYIRLNRRLKDNTHKAINFLLDPFPGYLEINGIYIDPDLSVDEINKSFLKKGDDRFYCSPSISCNINYGSKFTLGLIGSVDDGGYNSIFYDMRIYSSLCVSRDN